MPCYRHPDSQFRDYHRSDKSIRCAYRPPTSSKRCMRSVATRGPLSATERVTQEILDSLGRDDKPNGKGIYPTSVSPYAPLHDVEQPLEFSFEPFEYKPVTKEEEN